MQKKIIYKYSDAYPFLLREIYLPPQKLFVGGSVFWDNALVAKDVPVGPWIAIVGTRMPSDYGKKMAYKIARAICECGGVIVSGLAFGIDAICHRAAVDLNKPTVAVLASGIDVITPRSHQGLADAIVRAGGAVMSEYNDGDMSFKYRFAARNRIISGLCKATIVIEAGESSGALITARHAFRQNRDIYALMGDIERPQAQGCLKLVNHDMARPIVSIDGLMEDLKLDQKKNKIENLDVFSIKIINFLKTKPQTTGELMKICDMTVSDLNCSLGKLEILNCIHRNRQGKWQIVR